MSLGQAGVKHLARAIWIGILSLNVWVFPLWKHAASNISERDPSNAARAGSYNQREPLWGSHGYFYVFCCYLWRAQTVFFFSQNALLFSPLEIPFFFFIMSFKCVYVLQRYSLCTDQPEEISSLILARFWPSSRSALNFTFTPPCHIYRVFLQSILFFYFGVDLSLETHSNWVSLYFAKGSPWRKVDPTWKRTSR